MPAHLYKHMIIRRYDELSAEATRHNDKILKQVYLKPDQLPPLYQLARAIIPAGERVEAHQHASASEVFVILSGQATFIINQQSFELIAGDCAVAEPGDIHEIINTGPEDMEMLFFIQPG